MQILFIRLSPFHFFHGETPLWKVRFSPLKGIWLKSKFWHALSKTPFTCKREANTNAFSKLSTYIHINGFLFSYPSMSESLKVGHLQTHSGLYVNSLLEHTRRPLINEMLGSDLTSSVRMLALSIGHHHCFISIIVILYTYDALFNEVMEQTSFFLLFTFYCNPFPLLCPNLWFTFDTLLATSVGHFSLLFCHGHSCWSMNHIMSKLQPL